MSEQEANPNTEVVRGVWRDVSVASVHDLMTAAAPFKLTELQTHVLSDRRKLPQVIEGDDWLMVQFLLPKLHHTALRQQRLVVLLGTKELVTLHTGDLPEDLVEQIVLRMYKLDSPSGVLACIADAVTDLYGPILESIDDTIDTIEDTIMRRPTEEQLQQLFTYKKLLASLRRSVLPTTSMLGALSDGRYKMIEPKFAPYLRDSYDYMWRSRDLIDGIRDLLTGALDIYLSMVSNRMNDVMKRLTVVATIFLPVSFVAGVGGVNFVQMPFNSTTAFMMFIGICFLIPLVMLAYFRKQGWL